MSLSIEAAERKDKWTGGSASSIKLQHRHFALIAALIAEDGDYAHRCVTADRFARALARTNPAFDRTRFLRACGVAAD